MEIKPIWKVVFLYLILEATSHHSAKSSVRSESVSLSYTQEKALHKVLDTKRAISEA